MTFIDSWLKEKNIPAPDKAIAVRLDPQETKPNIVRTSLKKELAVSYLDPWEFEELFKSTDMASVFEYLREKHFPKDEKTRKGNFGETIAMAWVRDKLGYEVPLVKRRWAMNKERSQHGEDVIGFIFAKNGKDKLILVEAKFYLDQVPKAIKNAHETISKCISATECYSLHAIMSLFQERGDRDRYLRVRAMFNDYSGVHYEKMGAIFILTDQRAWKDSYFKDQISKNQITGLNCWALVRKDIEALYEECH